MRIYQLLRKVRSEFFFRMGVFNSKLNSLSSRSVLILTYHRILPLELVSEKVEPGMYVTPTTLHNHIRFLKKYFNIVSMTEAMETMLAHDVHESKKPLCILTFDDGWLDFYHYAWPILKKEEVASIVFLPTNLIGTSEHFWTDRLSYLLSSGGEDLLVENICDKSLRKKVSNIRSFEKRLLILIEVFKKLPYPEINLILKRCEIELRLSLQNHRSFMNWEEVRSLYNSGLVTFGSHTQNHAILTTLSDEQIYEELFKSKQKMSDEGLVDSAIHFCYPNGNYSQVIVNMVKDVGYSSAVSCDSGWNTINSNMFILKRISLHQDISLTDSLFAYRILG